MKETRLTSSATLPASVVGSGSFHLMAYVPRGTHGYTLSAKENKITE